MPQKSIKKKKDQRRSLKIRRLPCQTLENTDLAFNGPLGAAIHFGLERILNSGDCHVLMRGGVAVDEVIPLVKR